MESAVGPQVRSLPHDLTPFIGRVEEAKAVGSLVAANALVTLTGPGGCGKTRLALRVASERFPEDPNRTYFIDLSNVGDGYSAASAIARDLGLRAHPTSALNAVTDELSGRDHSLLVLDNCEQAVDDVAMVCHRLIEAVPTLRLLATSRERLNVPGEVVYAVPGLAVPPQDAESDDIDSYDAVRLFVERAHRARPDFAWSHRDAAAIGGICRRVDGLPLAIELAAACVRALSPARIEAGLSGRLRLLGDGPRTASPRHQSLRACIDWSYELLSHVERSVFRRLGVFVDPFDLTAVTGVVAGPDLGADDVRRVLMQLVDKSLVVADPARDRYGLLATLREYARERLDEAGETEETRRRHRDAFVAVAGSAYPVPWQDRDAALTDLAPVVDDLLAAFAFSDERGDADAMCRLSPGLITVLRAIHRQHEAVPVAARVAAMLPSASAVHRAELVASWAPWPGGVHPPLAPETAMEAVEIFRSRGERRGLALALVAAVEAGAQVALNEQLHAMAAEALDLGRRDGDPVVQTIALWSLARIEEVDDADAAAAHMAEAVPIAYRSDDGFGHSARWNLIKLHDRHGHHRAVLEQVHELLGTAEDGGSYRWRVQMHRGLAVAHLGDADAIEAEAARCRRVLGRRRPRARPDLLDSLIAHVQGLAAHVAGDLEAAERHYVHAQTILPEEPEADYAFRSIMIWRLWCRLGLGDHDAAMRDAASLLERPFGGPPEIDLSLLAGAVAARERGDDRFAESRAHELLPAAARARRDDVVATLLELLAGAALHRGGFVDAGRLAGAAHTLRDASGSLRRLPPHEGRHRSDITKLREALGEEAYRKAWTEGSGFGLTHAVAYARRGRGERGRPSTGWASLTPAERTVVDLVAAGLSNQQAAERLYVSVRTVASHLRRVFAKLGVRSRTELTRVALMESLRNT